MVRVVAFLVCILLVAGCAPRSHPLLEHDYARMTDSGLLRYRYDLENELSRCRQDASSGVSVGVGVGAGNYTGGTYVGVGVGRSTGPDNSCPTRALSERLRQVEAELGRRGLK